MSAKVGVEPLPQIKVQSKTVEEPEEILDESQFDKKEQEQRVESARRIQGVARTRKARQEANHRRELKRTRSSLPAQDSHGHANPSTIKFFNSFPLIWVHHHEETFFELFYDLIIVVVLMKLSYLKYEFTLMGFWTVVSIFANFWSCWALLNMYVTMVHQEDGLHRLFYAVFTTMAFIMCISTEHPDYTFFNFPTQAFFLAMVGIITRLLILGMYAIFIYQDREMRKTTTLQEYLPKYTPEQVYKQVSLQAGSIMLACIIFAITCAIEYRKTDSDETRRLAGDDGCRRLSESDQWWPRQLAGSDDGCAEEIKSDDTETHRLTIALWLIAVLVEQSGNIYSIIFKSLPFSGEYAGERMQAWLMLCFGESVIGLLISPSYYDSVSIKSIMASFVMVFCLVTVYFDVTDADKFLHLFILRQEKWKAFFYCLSHWPFSMAVFFIGVALKTINYIELGIHDLEVASGCGHIQHETLRRSRRLLWAEGGALDKLKERLGDAYESTVGQALGGDLALLDGGGIDHGRRLAAWTLDEYDELIYKSFLMLCFGVTAVQFSSVLVAYSMPTDQLMWKVHLSRFGSVIVVLFAIIIPFNLQSVKTDCLADYEDNHRRRLFGEDRNLATYSSYSSYSSTYSAYGNESWKHDKNMHGLTVVEALITTALIVIVSFIVSLFSIDVEREHTYKELEDAAHEHREPVMEKKASGASSSIAFLAKAVGKKGGTNGKSLLEQYDIEELRAAQRQAVENEKKIAARKAAKEAEESKAHGHGHH